MANINFPSSPTNGQLYNYGAATYQYDSTVPGWLAYPSLPGGVPAGTIVAWSTNTAPANWMICDGTAISRSTYASLFNVIGTTYGTGDGSTTFNLPNLKGRVAAGRDASQTEFDTLNETGGSKTNALYGTGTATGYGLTYSGSMNTADAGTASNLPPYLVLNYIIKTSMANTPGDSALATRVGALETFNTVAQPVAVGGTGATTLASGGYLKGNGTSAVTSVVGIPASDINSYMSPNYIINGAFDIWQRGTSLSHAGGGVGADMWREYTDSGTATQTRDTTNYPAGLPAQSYKFTATANSTNFSLFQILESSQCSALINQTITFSVYLMSSSSRTVRLNLGVNSTVDAGWSAAGWTTPSFQDVTVGTSWARYSFTVAVPSTARTVQFGISSNGANMSNASSISIAGVQVELGSVATPFRRNANSLQGELAACQRYYWRVNGKTGTETFSPTLVGISGTSASCGIQFPVSMRVAATPGFSALYANSYTGTNGTVTSISIGTGTDSTRMSAIGASYTTGMSYILQGLTTASYLDFSAEL